MTDFKVGDLVQIDPALVCGHAREYRGTGTVRATDRGGTVVHVYWPDSSDETVASRDLVLVSKPKEAA